MTYKRLALAAVGALALLAAGQNAQATTLADLTSGGTLSANGLIYSDFTDGGSLPASKVTVVVTSNGLQFTANWNTLTPGNDTSVIGYTVSVDPSVGGTLTSGGLSFAGHVIVSNAAASVGETLTDTSNANSTGIYSMQVFYDGPGGQADNLSDTVTFAPPVTSLRIVKSIDVTAGAGAFAALNFVDNTFVSAPGTGANPPIPEPMSLALLPLALVGLGLRKKLAQ